jgi:hypothetical protein
MSFTVDDFHDLIRLVETRPEWRAELRCLVLTNELLTVPDQLVALQARSEEQFQALTEAQQRTDLQLATLTEQVAALTRVVHTLTVDVGTLKGKSLEADYRSRGQAYLSRVVRRPHALTSDELVSIIEDARDRGVLSDIEARDLYETDLVVRGRRSEDGTEVYLVVEISWDGEPHDVERAVQRAHMLAHIGLVTIPVVAGEHILPEAADLARRGQVWQVTDGRAIPPAAAPSSP